MTPPHAELPRRGFSERRIGRSTVLPACIGLALVLGVVARSAPARVPLSFTAPKSYEAFGELGVWIRDLNGDGKPDLVTEGIVGASVLLNKGGGRFGEASYYEDVEVSELGDLNGDSSTDLVALDGGRSSVSVLLNNGAGAFGIPHDYETGLVPTAVAIADLNGDGVLDLATANKGDDTASVLLNRGDGTFLPHVDLRAGRRASSIGIRDLNGDGEPDLVVGNAGANAVSVLLNRGDGSFQARSDYTTGSAYPSIADLNRDGYPDLVAMKANAVAVLLNRGDGSFQAKVEYPTGRGGGGSIAIGDLTGDGAQELAVANFDAGTVSVLRNRGDGSFAAKHDYATGREPDSLAIADLNGDGRQDLVALNGDNFGRTSTASVLLNRGDGSFEKELYYAVGYATNRYAITRALAIGDLNGDGRLDLAATITGDEVPDVGVVINRHGLCNVQRLAGMTLAAAKQTLAHVNCRLGKLRRVYSKRVKKGRVITQKPGLGAVRPQGAKVDLVISIGGRR
jgi:hypothetical protein